MTEKTLTYDDLNISLKDIYVQMGYGEEIPANDIIQVTEEMIEEIRDWLKPRFVFFVTYGEIEKTENRIIIKKNQHQNIEFECSKIITRQLHASDAYAIFIATAGEEYETFLKGITQKKDMLKLFIADAIGSVIAEACGDKMEIVIQEQINKLNWKRTNRFSPGYCGWHVKEQKKLFPLFNGKTAGVELTDSALMMPIKSISGIIGLGPNVKYNDYTCGLCQLKDCYKRRSKK